MAKLPTPDRGQPLDVSYIYQVVDAINDISEQISTATYKYASIGSTSGTENVLITDTKVVAGTVDIYSTLTDVTPGLTVDKSFSFGTGEFKYPPIVTATPVLTSQSQNGSNLSVTIKQITTSRVDMSVTFFGTGKAALKLNLIAIGLPL
jgi:hypothetical protein